jgi:hypothetical protein
VVARGFVLKIADKADRDKFSFAVVHHRKDSTSRAG